MVFKSNKLKSLKSKILITWGLILILFGSLFLDNSAASSLNHHSTKTKTKTNLVVPIYEISAQAQKSMTCADFGTQFELKVDEVACINSGEVKLILRGIIQDSRCPSELNCFEAGQIQVAVKILVNEQDLGNLNLINNLSRKDLAIRRLDNYVIEFVKAEPYPKSNQEIKASDYIITLVVSQANDNCKVE